MKTIRAEWEIFDRVVVPPTAGPAQRTDQRHTFYAGAGAMLAILSEITSPGFDPLEGAAALIGLQNELRRYNEHVQALAQAERARGRTS